MTEVLVARLRRRPSRADREAIAALRAEIERRAAALGEVRPSPAVAEALTRARLESSNTLRSGRRRNADAAHAAERARHAFVRANERVIASVASGTPITIDGLRALDALLVGEAGSSPFRTTPSFIDGHACPPPEQIRTLVDPMLAEVEERRASDGLLFAAGLLHQWVVSVHPFADANGRTARLAVDWLLGLHGFAPISFDDGFEAFVAVHGDAADAERRTPRFAAEVVARGVLHTLGVLAIAIERP